MDQMQVKCRADIKTYEKQITQWHSKVQDKENSIIEMQT